MRTSLKLLTVWTVCLLFALHASATVLYVDLNNPNPTPPYTNWPTAATNIQDAVDAASAGDLILVNDGVYQDGYRTAMQSVVLPPTSVGTNRVVVNKAVTIQSLNGPSAAMINGGGVYRCVYLTNGSILSGFTLTNGAAGWSNQLTTTRLDGGGVLGGFGGSCMVSNCFVTDNLATGNGGGACDVTLVNCTLNGNYANTGGGAASSTLINCVVAGNNTPASGMSPLLPPVGVGGGIYVGSAINCLIVSNRAFQGGGVWGAVKLVGCTIVNNSVAANGGVSPNTIQTSFYSALTNCIIYFNSADTNANLGTGKLYIDHCCTVPLPAGGNGNFTNAPLFVNLTNNFHLSSNSPCINAGNNSFVTVTNDLDGNPRIVGGTVDIGAYENQTPASVLSYAWAQQYALPTDGSADSVDTDGDGLNNWAEWKAGTNPTNAASVLQLAAPSNSVSGVTVTWQSVSGINYYLQRSLALPGFAPVQSNLVGQAGTTSYLDASATNGGPYFYRVGVQ